MGGLFQSWRFGRMEPLTKITVQPILQKVFCDEIDPGTIVAGSCKLQVLDYDEATGLVDYILLFDALGTIPILRNHL